MGGQGQDNYTYRHTKNKVNKNDPNCQEVWETVKTPTPKIHGIKEGREIKIKLDLHNILSEIIVKNSTNLEKEIDI